MKEGGNILRYVYISYIPQSTDEYWFLEVGWSDYHIHNQHHAQIGSKPGSSKGG